MKSLMSLELIERKIFILRGHRVMLSPQLAEMYGVEIRVLVQAVKRNKERFPLDFMFQLTWAETENLKSQIVISSRIVDSRSQFVILKRGKNIKFRPYAFTEQGVSMLSSVLNSKQAIQVNIAIMRAFVKLRQLLNSHKDLARKLEELEKKYDAQFSSVFDAIKMLMSSPEDADAGLKKVPGFKPEK